MPITLQYPPALPLPTNRQGNTQLPGTVQADAAFGVPSVHKWSDDSPVRFSLVWNFDQDQLTAFLDFFHVDLDNGSRWFLLPLQWNDDEGGVTQELEVNFDSARPNYSNNGKRRIVTSTVIARSLPRDNQEFYDAFLPLLILDDEVAPLVDRLEIFSNEDMPGSIGP